MKSDLPKGFPDQDFLEAVAGARFRLIMPGGARMACQPDTGKVQRVRTMLQEEAAMTPMWAGPLAPYPSCGAVRARTAQARYRWKFKRISRKNQFRGKVFPLACRYRRRICGDRPTTWFAEPRFQDAGIQSFVK
jgi:hypothetical protein